MREDKCNGEIYAHDYMTNEDWYDFTVAQLRVTIQYQDCLHPVPEVSSVPVIKHIDWGF